MEPPSTPEAGDVVIGQDTRDGLPIYVLHTADYPEQLVVRSHDAALHQARTFARRQRVRVWMTSGDHDFTLIEDFRVEAEAL